jgi:NADH-quinone oxidoreductase subunit I
MSFKDIFPIPGTGLIQGLSITAKNAVQSYFKPEFLTTVNYPEVKEKLPENNRNFPFLVFDGKDPEAGLRCVACKICERECPPQCIYIDEAYNDKGKPARKPEVFDIDISVCMSCQICVEVCPFDAIMMDQVYELSSTDRFLPLILSKEELAKSNEYYHSIHPAEAAEIDAARAAAAAAKAAKGCNG